MGAHLVLPGGEQLFPPNVQLYMILVLLYKVYIPGTTLSRRKATVPGGPPAAEVCIYIYIYIYMHICVYIYIYIDTVHTYTVLGQRLQGRGPGSSRPEVVAARLASLARGRLVLLFIYIYIYIYTYSISYSII